MSYSAFLERYGKWPVLIEDETIWTDGCIRKLEFDSENHVLTIHFTDYGQRDVKIVCFNPCCIRINFEMLSTDTTGLVLEGAMYTAEGSCKKLEFIAKDEQSSVPLVIEYAEIRYR